MLNCWIHIIRGPEFAPHTAGCVCPLLQSVHETGRANMVTIPDLTYEDYAKMKDELR